MQMGCYSRFQLVVSSRSLAVVYAQARGFDPDAENGRMIAHELHLWFEECGTEEEIFGRGNRPQSLISREVELSQSSCVGALLILGTRCESLTERGTSASRLGP